MISKMRLSSLFKPLLIIGALFITVSEAVLVTRPEIQVESVKVVSHRDVVHDMESFIEGVASVFASELHWVSCVKDVYSVAVDARSLEANLNQVRWGEWKQDITVIKGALGDVKTLCESIKGAISDCDLEELAGKLGAAIAKLSEWVGELEEAASVAIHIITFVEDSIDVVEGIESGNWHEVGTGVGGLIDILA